LAIFLVEATGRLSEDSMKLAKFIVKDSASRSILNLFCTQIGGAIARYNAMAAHAWVQYYLRSSHISVGEVTLRGNFASPCMCVHLTLMLFLWCNLKT